ncbi:FAD binding domain-containing protein [Teratosphaeria destructans]|uniref:FAD binding domain-containing protein n=1 Tax=Teratosphaeria destructans TaxID=418781 RepID=A0A9W7W415_9PEZI|nr:FAD binding domain-containing protein [Teratosphaeria destructans]
MFIRLLSSLVLVAPVVVSDPTLINVSHGLSPADEACDFLARNQPNNTYFSTSSLYETDESTFWSQACALGPACEFAPSSAQDLGWAVRVLKQYGAPFAMRGGGHMPIAGFNGIDSSGVLLSSSRLTHLYWESDGSSVHVGPGNHWENVYEFLEPHGQMVVGGRLGLVGVPGFVMGGGISFFGWQYGWSSNNLYSFTCVLANGNVVLATPDNEYADLFWALRGGGNSFCLVTDIQMKTYYKPATQVGITAYGAGPEVSRSWFDALDGFSNNGMLHDQKASIIPIINTGSAFNNSISHEFYRFYDGNDSTPAVYENFTGPKFPPVSETFGPKSMHGWSQEINAFLEVTIGLRQRFWLIPLATNRQALEIATDVFFSQVSDALGAFDVWSAAWSPIPVSPHFLNASRHANGHGLPDGDPMGAEPVAQYMIELSLSYSDIAAYEDVVTEFLIKVDADIRSSIRSAGLADTLLDFYYLNDVDKDQADQLWNGYPKENVRLLQEIRRKYDPEMVFTDQMPGGWKVAHANVTF